MVRRPAVLDDHAGSAFKHFGAVLNAPCKLEWGEFWLDLQRDFRIPPFPLQ